MKKSLLLLGFIVLATLTVKAQSVEDLMSQVINSNLQTTVAE